MASRRASPPPARVEQAVDDRRLEPVDLLVDVDQLGQLVVVEDREREPDLPARLRAGREQVALGPDGAAEARDQLLADGVERRVGDLGEQLGEVVEQQAGAVRQDGDRRVGAHRPEGLAAGLGHRRHEDPLLLERVAEGQLAADDVAVRVPHVGAVGQRVEGDEVVVEPLLVRRVGGELGLDLVVVDDPALGGVDQEHAARLEPALLHDRALVDVEDADLRGHDHEVVAGDPVARRAQAVAVEHRADDRAVGERHRRRAVPRLHQRRSGTGRRPAWRGPSPRGSPTPRGSSSARRGAAGGRRGGAARAPRRSWPSRWPRACRSGTAGRGRRGTGRSRAAPRGPASSCGCP